MTEVRLLGTPEIWHEGTVLRLVSRQQRIVLGALALKPNQLVAPETLIELLWGGRPPREARAVTQTRVSELKAMLRRFLGETGEVRIEGRAGGYLFAGSPERIDAHQFLSMLNRARQAGGGETARQLITQALSLWHGPVLGGGLTDAAYDSLCSGLESAQLNALELLYGIELQLGNHAVIVDETVRTAVSHPTREGLMKLALLALRRTGRIGDALREYDRWRRWLRDELGVDPGRDLQELYLAMLRADESVEVHTVAAALPAAPLPGSSEALEPSSVPALVRTAGLPAVPHTVPPDTSDFTGRVSEIELARRVLTGTRTTAGVIVFAGPGGVGKTALAVHIAHLLSAQFPDGQLMVNMRGFDEGEPVTVADVLSRLLRSFGLDPAGIPHTVEDRIDVYRTFTAGRRVLILLDNAASDDQVRQLIPTGRGCGMIITSRARLGGTLGAMVEQIAALRPADATDLLSAIAGQDRTRREPAAAVELCARCGHLPLAIRVVAARLQAKPHWALANMVMLLGDERRRLDHLTHGQLDLRASISLSYQGLDAVARQLLRAVGDLGVVDVTPWLAAALLDTELSEAGIRLEQLFDVQLLDVADRDTDHVRYRVHDFVRLYAQERAMLDDDEASRAAARRRVYRSWLTVADHAHAALLGGGYRNIRGDSPRRPVDGALLERITRGPVAWFETERQIIATVVRRAADDDASGECWELTSTMSPFFEICRYYDEWATILDTGLALTRRTGDIRGEAAMLYRAGCAWADRVDHAAAWRCFQDADALFKQIGDSHGHATATLFTATIDRFRGDLDAALARYEEVLPALHDSGDLGGEAQALRGIGQVHLDHGAYEKADEFLDRSILLCRRAGWPLGEAQGLFWHGMLMVKKEHHRDAELRFRAAQEICRAIGDRSGEAQTMRGLALCLRSRGETDQARAALGEALHLVRQPYPTLLEQHIRRAIADLDAESVATVTEPC